MAPTKKRHYPKALSRLLEKKDAGESQLGLSSSSAIQTPFGAPVVRRGIAVGKEAPEDVPLEDAVKRLFCAENPDGTRGFQIEIKDELFDRLRCSIDIMVDGRVRAIFYVQDHNLRRLLEAESARLRAQLEGRGLKVGEVLVVVASEG
tara:strand:+ start:53 stop:496 length:444 start_codon:yes stop_codon:yes gene_type:complete